MKKKKEINWERWHWLKQHIKRVRKSPEPEEPQTKMANYLTTIFAAIPLITASIYLSGMAHFFAKCLVYGLNISEFPQPTDVTLATGYFLWLMAGKTVWAYFPRHRSQHAFPSHHIVSLGISTPKMGMVLPSNRYNKALYTPKSTSPGPKTLPLSCLDKYHLRSRCHFGCTRPYHSATHIFLLQ